MYLAKKVVLLQCKFSVQKYSKFNLKNECPYMCLNMQVTYRLLIFYSKNKFGDLNR